MNSDQLVNDIEKLKQHNILIENKLKELRIFYITNKEKYDYKLAKTFLDNLENFIEKEIFGDDLSFIKGKIGDQSNDLNNFIIINYCKSIKGFIEEYLCYSNMIINGGSNYKQADITFNFICNYGEERLIFRMLMNEKKLKCYENILKLYPETELDKPEIENIMDLYPEKPEIEPEKNSVSISVIILIMIVFYVITIMTVVVAINHNHIYNTAAMHHICSKNNQIITFIDKQNKLKDIMLI